jgi:hypothetical protein
LPKTKNISSSILSAFLKYMDEIESIWVLGM